MHLVLFGSSRLQVATADVESKLISMALDQNETTATEPTDPPGVLSCLAIDVASINAIGVLSCSLGGHSGLL